MEKLEKFRNTRSSYHVIFCVDCSASMASLSPCPEEGSSFKATHNNRLGAAFQACQIFMRQVEQEGLDCVYSLVQFASSKYTKAVIRKEHLSTDQFSAQLAASTPANGTNYASALKCILDNKLIQLMIGIQYKLLILTLFL